MNGITTLHYWTSREPRWSFVVDTDRNAHSFARGLCAYVTGHSDYRGQNFALEYIKMFDEEYPTSPFEGLIDYRLCDDGLEGPEYTYSPMAVAPGCDGQTFNSVAIFLKREPDGVQRELLTRRAIAFSTLATAYLYEGVRTEILGTRLVGERTILDSRGGKPLLTGPRTVRLTPEFMHKSLDDLAGQNRAVREILIHPEDYADVRKWGRDVVELVDYDGEQRVSMRNAVFISSWVNLEGFLILCEGKGDRSIVKIPARA
jgi:hypothetical protein